MYNKLTKYFHIFWLIIILLVNLNYCIEINDEIYDGLSNPSLGSDIYPFRYELWIKSDIHKGDLNYSGRVIIEFITIKDLDKIHIDAKQLNITNIKLIYKNEILFKDLRPTYACKKNYFSIQTEGLHLNALENYKLDIDFYGNLSSADKAKGFWYSSYKKDNKTHFFAATQFKDQVENKFAKTVFPCVDKLGIKSNFKLHLTHHKSYFALSTTPGIRNFVDNEYIETTFAETPKIPVYTFSFAILDLNSRRLESNENIKITVYAQNKFINSSILMFNRVQEYLKIIENYSGINYPLSKLDCVLLPDAKHMGMENFGLIMFAEDAVGYKESTAEVVHEISRQIFGNIITPKSLKYIWLSKGIASYMEDYILDIVYPDYKYSDIYITKRLHNGFEKCFGEEGGIAAEENYKNEINTNSAVYIKAANFLRMLSHIITEPTFHKALKYFVQQNQYKSVDNVDFIKAINYAVKLDNSLADKLKLKLFIEQWLQKPEFPTLTVNRNFDKPDQLHLSQKAFGGSLRYYMESEEDLKSNEMWIIPYNYATKKNPDFLNTAPMGWMTNASVEITTLLTNEEWIVFNKQQTGFYIVNYDTRNWNLIAEELIHGNDEKIHYKSRAQLIHDANILLSTDELEYDTLVQLLTGLYRETNFLVWQTADPILDEFNELLSDSNYASIFKDFILKSIYLGYDKVRFNRQLNSNYILQGAISKWACKMKYLSCIQDAETLVETFLQNINKTTNQIPEDLLAHALNFGIESDQLYSRVWNTLNFLNDTSIRNIIISSLSTNIDKSIYLEVGISLISENFRNKVSYLLNREYHDLGITIDMNWNTKNFLKAVQSNYHNILDENNQQILKKIESSMYFSIRCDEDVSRYKEIIKIITEYRGKKYLSYLEEKFNQITMIHKRFGND